MNFFLHFSPKKLYSDSFYVRLKRIKNRVQEFWKTKRRLTWHIWGVLSYLPQPFYKCNTKAFIIFLFLCDRKSRASFCNLTLMAAVRATNLAWVVSVTSCAAGAPSAGNACDALKNGTCAQMSNPTKSF